MTTASSKLYGAKTDADYRQAQTSLYSVRQVVARRTNDITRAKALEFEEKEFAKLCGELGLNAGEALAFGSRLQDLQSNRARLGSNAESPRTQLTDRDRERLITRFGERVEPVMQATAKRFAEILKDKPNLANAIREANAVVDGDCVLMVAEAVDRAAPEQK